MTKQELKKLKDKEYRLKNAEKIKQYRIDNKEKRKIYLKENAEKISKQHKDYLIENKDSVNVQRKTYRKNNRAKINSYRNNKKKTDPLFKLTTNIRIAITKSITKQGYTKKSKTFNILGCSYDEMKLHLESNFESWMNWNNYGLYNGKLNYGWDIDHVIPLSSATSEDDIIRLNHYTNLQPLCSYTNRCVKRDK